MPGESAVDGAVPPVENRRSLEDDLQFRGTEEGLG